jgi:hypothetical protein
MARDKLAARPVAGRPENEWDECTQLSGDADPMAAIKFLGGNVKIEGRQNPRWCCVKKVRKRHAVREMKEDPSEPPCRRRLQTAMSCFGQKPR